MQRHRGHLNHRDSGDRVTVVIAILNCNQAKKKEGTVNKLKFQPSPQVANSSCDFRRRLKDKANRKQYRSYYECEYCPLKSKESPHPHPPQFFLRSESIVCKNLMSTSRKQSLSSKQMSVIYSRRLYNVSLT